MRGTIAFERLNCKANKGNSVNVRILLNDAVYRKCPILCCSKTWHSLTSIAIPSCRSGPGSSCPVDEYARYVAKQKRKYGSYASICGLGEDELTTIGEDESVTFFKNLTLPFLGVVKP